MTGGATQEPLWLDSLAEALVSLVEAPELGGAKRIGSALWPTLAPVEAARKLRHSLDPERGEKLSLEEIDHIIGMGRRAGCHAVMTYLGQRHSYRVIATDPEDTRARLMREYVEATHALLRLSDRLERMGAPGAGEDSLASITGGRR